MWLMNHTLEGPTCAIRFTVAGPLGHRLIAQLLPAELERLLDRAGDLDPRVGVGTGVRWRSPVGPLQADLAYGVKTKEVRLHLRLGFSF